jgi:hypothetical protein
MICINAAMGYTRHVICNEQMSNCVNGVVRKEKKYILEILFTKNCYETKLQIFFVEILLFLWVECRLY